MRERTLACAPREPTKLTECQVDDDVQGAGFAAGVALDVWEVSYTIGVPQALVLIEPALFHTSEGMSPALRG